MRKSFWFLLPFFCMDGILQVFDFVWMIYMSLRILHTMLHAQILFVLVACFSCVDIYTYIYIFSYSASHSISACPCCLFFCVDHIWYHCCGCVDYIYEPSHNSYDASRAHSSCPCCLFFVCGLCIYIYIHVFSYSASRARILLVLVACFRVWIIFYIYFVYGLYVWAFHTWYTASQADLLCPCWLFFGIF